jgi:hypothetical protein
LAKLLLDNIKLKSLILFNIQKRNMHNSSKVKDFKTLQDKTGTWFYLDKAFLQKNLKIGYIKEIDETFYTGSVKEKLIKFNFGDLLKSNDFHWRKISNFIFGPKLIKRPLAYLDLGGVLVAFPLTRAPAQETENADIGKEKGIGFVLKNIGKTLRDGQNVDQSILINPIIYDRKGYVVQEEIDEVKCKTIVSDKEVIIDTISSNKEEVVPIIALGTEGRERLEKIMKNHKEEYALGYLNQERDNAAWISNKNHGELAKNRLELFEKQIKSVSINNSNARFHHSSYYENANNNFNKEKLVFKVGETLGDFRKKL